MLSQWLLFFHVVGAVLYVGGIITVGVQALRADTNMRAFLDFNEVAGRTIGAGALIVFASGIAMVIESSIWRWTDAFVIFGITALVFSGAVDGLFFRPRTRQLEAALAEEGPDSPDVAAFARQLTIANWLFVVLFLAVILAMVFRWGA